MKNDKNNYEVSGMDAHRKPAGGNSGLRIDPASPLRSPKWWVRAILVLFAVMVASGLGAMVAQKVLEHWGVLQWLHQLEKKK